MIGEITCLTNAIFCYDVHVSVGSRLIGYFFLKILKTDISKKMKFLFSDASARTMGRRLAMDIYGLIAPLLQFLMRGPSRSVRRPETWRKCCVWNIEIATDPPRRAGSAVSRICG
jgi:hypothetical protein